MFYKTIINPTASEWVVFIHGIGGGSAVFFRQIRAFKEHYNLLLIDLPGHGKSNHRLTDKNEKDFYAISGEVVAVMDELEIDSAHFVGVSMGTIVIQVINYLHPQRVKKMVLAGAVEHLNLFARIVCRIVNPIKNVVPYMTIYRIAAWVLMPLKRHKLAREVFVNEAVRLGQEEFTTWFQLHTEVDKTIQEVRSGSKEKKLYVMGGEDYMFLPFIEKAKDGALHIIEKCGHVCNI